MTEPTPDEPRPDSLPNVDTVIHDARESSWQLPGSTDHPPDPMSVEMAAEPLPTENAAATHAAALHPPAVPAAGVHASTLHAAAAAHGPAAHGPAASAHGAHGSEEDAPPGPIDMELLISGLLGTVIGLFMAVCFVLATSGMGAY